MARLLPADAVQQYVYTCVVELLNYALIRYAYCIGGTASKVVRDYVASFLPSPPQQFRQVGVLLFSKCDYEGDEGTINSLFQTKY